MHRRMRLAVAASVAGVLAAGGAQAQAADPVFPFTNWQVGGTLTLAKLRQNVQFPPGATFNGYADLISGRLSGNVFIPPFTSTIRVLGIPTQVTEQIKQVSPVAGTVKITGTSVSVTSSTTDDIYVRSVGLGPIEIPTTCHTASPVKLTLDYRGPLNLAKGFVFGGATTIPSLTGCGLLGPVLSSLISGPGNRYRITLTPPAAS